MAGTNQFSAFAVGVGANLVDLVTYGASTTLNLGQQPGLAQSAYNNRALRQATTMAAALAQFAVNQTGGNMLDDGTVTNQTAGILSAVQLVASSGLQWSATTAYSATQIVTYQGAIYIALASNTNSAPPSSNWLPYDSGVLSYAVTASSSTLTALQSAYEVMQFTGALTANSVINIQPTNPGTFVVTNNTSGAFTLTVKMLTGSGATLAIPQGFTQAVYQDGTNVYAVGPAVNTSGAIYNVPSIQGAYKSLQITAPGTSAVVSLSAGSVILQNSAGVPYATGAFSLNCTMTTAGAGGLDTGTVAASTWYYMYLIYNPTTSTLAALASLSSTAPTLPSGYTFAGRVGSLRTDGTASKFPLSFRQAGRDVQYVVATGSNVTALPIIVPTGANGSISTGPTVAVSVSAFVPPTASKIKVTATSTSGSNNIFVMGPNNSYGGLGSATNPPPMALGTIGNAGLNVSMDFILESSNIYFANQANAIAQVIGWTDNL